MHNLVLASQSPRRRELLERNGFIFTVASVEISEIPNENLSLPDQIQDLAWQKAQALSETSKLAKGQGFLLLSADTVVVLDSQILGKPRDLQQSREHICRLSGQTHQVITGICLWELDSGRTELACATAEVQFRKLNDLEINAYVATKEGMDKAGAYGAQGKGRELIAHIEGDLDTVMGLSIKTVETLLRKGQWTVERKK